MSVAHYLSGYVAEPRKRSSAVFRRTDRLKRHRGRLGVDEDLIHPCGDCGTIEREKELENRQPSGAFRIRSLKALRAYGAGLPVSEDYLPGTEDFRDNLDPVVDRKACICQGRGCQLCVTELEVAEFRKVRNVDIEPAGRNRFGTQMFHVHLSITTALRIGAIRWAHLKRKKSKSRRH